MFQDEKVRAESTKMAMIQEKKILLQELDFAREQLENLQSHHEEFEVKSKADVKLLVKEVKSLRSSQLDLKQELSQLMKEKLEVEVTYFFFFFFF
jgi:predicted  nucleic acid-binding Zn-ribbon protein